MSQYYYAQSIEFECKGVLPDLLQSWCNDKTKCCENCRYFHRCEIKNYEFEEAIQKFKIDAITIDKYHITICGLWDYHL